MDSIRFLLLTLISSTIKSSLSTRREGKKGESKPPDFRDKALRRKGIRTGNLKHRIRNKEMKNINIQINIDSQLKILILVSINLTTHISQSQY